MPEPVQTGERGVHRFRTVFFSDEDGLSPCESFSVAEPQLIVRMRESVSHHRAVSFLIVDSRLLASGSNLLSLFPRELIERLSLMGGVADVHGETPIRAFRRHRWRTLFPLMAGAAAAAAGFWVFFQRAL